MTQQIDPTCEPGPDVATEVRRRNLPRALTPFRHRSYRRLAVALVVIHFHALLTAQGLQGHLHHDALYPGPKGRVLAKRGQLLKHRHKSILQGILG